MTKRSAIIEWMRYKSGRCWNVKYFTFKIKKDIMSWDYKDVVRVFKKMSLEEVKLRDKLFKSNTCPYCLKHNILPSSIDPDPDCKKCFYGKLNGICLNADSLFEQEGLIDYRFNVEDIKVYHKLFKEA